MPSKKRKRETVEGEPPRITYDAPSRAFDRLFREDSLEEMKDVVRKKLGIASYVPIHLSRVRDGTSVDLEDDDDFEAFRVFVHASQTAEVNVVVGSDAPITEPLPNGDSEFRSSSEKKKKKKSNATVQSSVVSPSALADSPPLKKRRVSFVEPPGDHLQQNAVVVPATPDKKKRKSVVGSSEPGNELPSDISSKGVTNESTEKKKKKKKTSAAVSEELALHHPENGVSGAETIPETPPTKKTKKRTREEDSLEIISSSRLHKTDSLADQEDHTSRPGKKSRKKRGETVDEPESRKISRSKSVPPPSSRQTDILASPALPSEPESPIKSKKTRTKGKDRGVSEPPSAAAPSSPELVQHDKASTEKKQKGKSKIKVDEPSSLDTPGAKPAEVKKNNVNQVQQKESSPRDTSTPDQTTKKKEKTAEGPRESLSIPKETSRKDKDLDEPSSPVETKTPKTRRKSQDAGTSKPSRLEKAAGKSRNSDNSQISEEVREAALAVIQAVLSRKAVAASATSNVPQASAPPHAPAYPPPSSDGEEELAAEEEEASQPCPLCDESPTHDRPLCPVIKGGVRTMRKRVTELQKDTSGDEKKQEEREQVIEELQAMIQKRSRPRKTPNVPVKVGKASDNALPAPPAPIAVATKPAKKVDVVSPPTRVVDVIPPIASSKPVKSLPSNSKSLKSAKQPSSSRPAPASQQASTSQKSIATTAQDTENLMANLPLVGDPSSFGLGELPFEDLSQLTDNDLQSIIHGRKVSIADVPSSDEDEEEEQDEESPFLDEDEPQPKTPRRLSQGSSRVEYPSSSDAEEEDENSAEGVSNAKELSLSEGEDQADDRQTSEEPLAFGEGDTSFREVDSRGSSREIDRTGDDAFDAALAEDFATLNAVLPINGKRRTTEDSDTAVGSQVEELADLQAKAKQVGSTKAVTTIDPIEPSEEPLNAREELIISDGDHSVVQTTPKVESIIRTRSQRKQLSEQEDSVVQPLKAAKKTRKITELPVPSLSSARVVKPSSSSNTGARRIKTAVQQDHEAKGSEDADDPPPKSSTKVGSKAIIKDTKRSTSTRSKAATSEISKAKPSTKAGSRVSAANGTAKTKSGYKITPTEPIGFAQAINGASDGGNNTLGSQWAVLRESNPLTETPGQVDELISEFATPALLMMKRGREAGDPLFLPSQTPYSQYSGSFASQRRNGTHEPSHESDDEKEVLATVVKPTRPIRTYRSLSQIASSQTFAAPQFQAADFGRSKEPDSLYGRNRRNSEASESESSGPESDLDKSPVASHIPASRRAGILNK